MASDITLLGATYSSVPAVLLPKSGGGTVKFTDVTQTDAVESNVESGKVFFLADGSIALGTRTISLQSKNVTPSESVQSVGYDSGYDGLSKVTVAAISSTYVGTGITRRVATTYNVSTNDQTIASGQYLTGAQTIRGVTYTGLSSSYILNGVTVKIGDAADDDRIALVSGNVTFQHYYTGSSVPSSSLGVNGDIYLQT